MYLCCYSYNCAVLVYAGGLAGFLYYVLKLKQVYDHVNMTLWLQYPLRGSDDAAI